MKHFLLILVVLVVGYAGWQVSNREARRLISSGLSYHVPRLGGLLLAAMLLAWAAFHFSSTPIF